MNFPLLESLLPTLWARNPHALVEQGRDRSSSISIWWSHIVHNFLISCYVVSAPTTGLFSASTTRINGRPQDFRRTMCFMHYLVLAHFSMPESCVCYAVGGRNVSSPTWTESPWALRLRSPYVSSLLDFGLANVWYAQVRTAGGYNKRLALWGKCLSVTLLCGLCKEVGVATLNNSCTARASAAIPNLHLTVILRTARTFSVNPLTPNDL
jgi:hypothetical protein